MTEDATDKRGMETIQRLLTLTGLKLALLEVKMPLGETGVKRELKLLLTENFCHNNYNYE